MLPSQSRSIFTKASFTFLKRDDSLSPSSCASTRRGRGPQGPTRARRLHAVTFSTDSEHAPREPTAPNDLRATKHKAPTGEWWVGEAQFVGSGGGSRGRRGRPPQRLGCATHRPSFGRRHDRLAGIHERDRLRWTRLEPRHAQGQLHALRSLAGPTRGASSRLWRVSVLNGGNDSPDDPRTPPRPCARCWSRLGALGGAGDGGNTSICSTNRSGVRAHFCSGTHRRNLGGHGDFPAPPRLRSSEAENRRGSSAERKNARREDG